MRAYKGQADKFQAMGDKGLLEYALQIHTVEARHASISRRILGSIRGNGAIKGWITNDEGSPAPVYKGTNSEANLIQGGVDLTTLTGLGGLSGDALKKAASEAFDEILTKQEVLDIATLFIA